MTESNDTRYQYHAGDYQAEQWAEIANDLARMYRSAVSSRNYWEETAREAEAKAGHRLAQLKEVRDLLAAERVELKEALVKVNAEKAHWHDLYLSARRLCRAVEKWMSNEIHNGKLGEYFLIWKHENPENLPPTEPETARRRFCLTCKHEPDWVNNHGKCKVLLVHLIDENDAIGLRRYTDTNEVISDEGERVINCTGWEEKEPAPDEPTQP